MTRLLLFFAVFLFSGRLFCQELKEKLIVTDTDSSLLKAQWASFSRTGNYCFVTSGSGDKYFVTDKKKYGPYLRVSNRFESFNGIYYSFNYQDEEKEWYYVSSTGICVFGPVRGKLQRMMNAAESDSIALTVLYGDSVYYYLNGRLFNTLVKAAADFFSIYDWCAFSPNGNALYYKIRPGQKTLLYKNGQLIDSARSFTELHINNEGKCIYGAGERPKQKGKYDYYFFAHGPDTAIGPLRTVWNSDIRENGGYYQGGDDNGPQYIIVNGHIFRDVGKTSGIMLFDRNHYCFSYYADHDKTKMIVNGNETELPYEKVYDPVIDDKGNFACYGLKNYYLYRFVNGRQLDSVSAYGVRGVPVYISASGSSLHYFRTDDSTYIFRDKQQLFPAFSNNHLFQITEGTEKFPYYWGNYKRAAFGSLLYMELDSSGYFIYNGLFSKKLIAVKNHSYGKIKKTGELVSAAFTEKGFFFIQKTGKTEYLLGINNAYYTTLKGIDRVVSGNTFFDGKTLIFYAIKGKSFYQYTVTL